MPVSGVALDKSLSMSEPRFLFCKIKKIESTRILRIQDHSLCDISVHIGTSSHPFWFVGRGLVPGSRQIPTSKDARDLYIRCRGICTSPTHILTLKFPLGYL